MLWLTYRLTGSPTAMGIIGLFEYAPHLMFGLVGGVLSDRFDRRHLMMATSTIRTLVVALVPVLYILDALEPWHLAAVAVVQSSASAFFAPARSALLVNILPEADYQRGSAAYSATMRTARIFGPLIGTVLLRVVSTEVLFLIDAVSFLGCILTTWAIRIPVRKDAATAAGVSLWAGLVAAAGRFGSNRLLSMSWVANGLGMAVWTGLYTIGMTLLAEERIGGGETTYAMLATAYGIGNVLANLLVADRPIRNRTAWIFGGWLFFAAGFFALGLTTNLYVGLISIGFASMGAPISDLAMALKIRSDVPEEDLGKAYSLWYTGSSGGSAVGLLLFGPLFNGVSVVAGFVFGAAGLACLGLWGVLVLARREHAPVRRGSR